MEKRKSLIYYLWDKIRLTDKEGHVVTGDVFSHSFEDDLERDIESIDIDTGEKDTIFLFPKMKLPLLR